VNLLAPRKENEEMRMNVGLNCCLLSLLIVVLIVGFCVAPRVLGQDQGCDGRRAAQRGDCTNAQPCSNLRLPGSCNGGGGRENVRQLSLDCVTSTNQNCISVTEDCYDEVTCKWDSVHRICVVDTVRAHTHRASQKLAELRSFHVALKQGAYRARFGKSRGHLWVLADAR